MEDLLNLLELPLLVKYHVYFKPSPTASTVVAAVAPLATVIFSGCFVIFTGSPLSKVRVTVWVVTVLPYLSVILQ